MCSNYLLWYVQQLNTVYIMQCFKFGGVLAGGQGAVAPL